MLVMRDFGPPLFPSKSPLPFKYPAKSPFQTTTLSLFSLSCRSDKKAAAEGPDEKELKKKEKQRLEREKKELKEKQEKEKKEQKEREKKENEMKKKFKVSGVILTEKGGTAGGGAAGEGGVYVLAYKPVWIHSSQ